MVQTQDRIEHINDDRVNRVSSGYQKPMQVERGLRPWPRDEYLESGIAADLISIKYTRHQC